MRFYTISIVDQNNALARDSAGNPMLFTSLIKSNSTRNSFRGQQVNTSALNVEFDIPVASQGQPTANSYIKIWGIPLYLLSQANQFATPVDSKIKYYCVVQAGMWKGLPLANPYQSGVITRGLINKSFGNWQGTNQTLEIYLSPTNSYVGFPQNLVLTWKKGYNIQDALVTCISTAIKASNQKVDYYSVTISPNIVAPQDIEITFSNFSDLAHRVNEISRKIINNPSYTGVEINFLPSTATSGVISITDNFTYFPKPKNIKFQDLIGQPTWIDIALISMNVVLRADLQVGDFIQLPQQFDNLAVITQPAGQRSTVNQPQGLRTNSIFNNVFRIVSLRHLGNFRQPTGDSWVTVIQAQTTGKTISQADPYEMDIA